MSFEKKNPDPSAEGDSFLNDILNRIRGGKSKMEDPAVKKMEQCKKFIDDTMVSLVPQFYQKGVDGFGKGFVTTVDVHSVQHGSHFEARSPFMSMTATTSMGGENSKYKVNEDALGCFVSEDFSVIEVFDGAGGSGHQSGQLASAVGVMRATEAAIAGMSVKEIGQQVHEAVKQKTPGGYTAGVIMKAYNDGKVEAVYAADTRMLTLRKGAPVPEGTTKFQNMAALIIDSEMKLSEDKRTLSSKDFYTMENLNQITGSFGGTNEFRSEPGEIAFQSEKGDVVVIATDGVWDNISDYEISMWSKENPDPNELLKKIMDEALKRNNVRGPFEIQHDAKTLVTKQIYAERKESRGWGDNVTACVVVL